MPAPDHAAARTAKLIQLTDCHLSAGRDTVYKGVNPYRTLARVCDYVRERHGDADALLLTGDLSHDGSVESYRLLNELVARTGLPARALPGNHDDWPALRGTLSLPIVTDRTLRLDGWEILLAHSNVEGQVEGRLSDDELAWLGERLARPAAPAQLLAVHHQPLPVGSPWMDRVGLVNGERLFELAGGDSRLKVIVHGHAHQVSLARRGNIACYGTPSTWRQFTPGSPELRMDFLPPALRVLRLGGNGDCRSWVEFV